MIKESIKKYGIYLLIFMIALTLRFIAMSKKNTVFFDAPATFISSTPNNLTPEGKIAKISWREYNFEIGKDYTGKQIKETLFSADSSIKSVFNDILTMRTHNIDNPHSNVYYSLIRIIDMGIDGTNIKQMIIRGCFLNIIFFCFSFYINY